MSEYETKFNWNGVPDPRVEVTLRDQIAMAALTWLLSQKTVHYDINITTNDCYKYADAMMRARNE